LWRSIIMAHGSLASVVRSFGPKVLTHAKQGCAKMTGVSRLGSKSESKMSRLDFSIVRLSLYYVFSLKSEDLP
jgi:hypothetical protein